MKAFFGRLRDGFARNKSTILHFALLILSVAAVSVLSFFLLRAFGVMDFNAEGQMVFNGELFASFSDAWYGWIFFILLQTVLSMLLCVFPGVSMALIILSTTVVFPGQPWRSFILCFVSVLIASITMYIVGCFGGYRLTVRFVGQEDADRALDLLRDKGTFFFPFMMLFPFFPDEALTMVAGTTRMRLSWFLPSIIVARGIGIATIVFGLSVVPFDRFTTFWHWLVFVLLVVLLVLAVLFGASRFNRYMERKKAEEATGEATEE